MTKKIFKSNILVAAAVLIFGIACVMAILYQHFGKQINTELKKEATYLVYGVEENGIDYLKQIKENLIFFSMRVLDKKCLIMLIMQLLIMHSAILLISIHLLFYMN